LQIKPPIDLVAGLRSNSEAIQLLVLRLVSSATHNVADIGIVAAAKPELVVALVDVWLRTNSTAVADRARGVLSRLLITEYNASRPGSLPGAAKSGLMARRFFRDKDVYGLLFSLCSLRTVGQEGQPSKHDKTIAQGRLLDLLKDLVPYRDVWQPHMPDIERSYTVTSQGLMEFALTRMVGSDDVLLQTNFIDFCTNIIGAPSRHSLDSVSTQTDILIDPLDVLDSLKRHGVHKRVSSYYMKGQDQDSLDFQFLSGPSAKYIAAYAESFATQLVDDEATSKAIVTRLYDSLNAVPNSQWARNDGPSRDLHIVASLPRVALLPRYRKECPLLGIPTKPGSADAFKTLASVFHGGHAADATASRKESEKQAARALFIMYIGAHPHFWAHLVDASSVSAITDTAVAAIDCMTAIVTAKWETSSTAGASTSWCSIPSEAELERSCAYYRPLPANGTAAVLYPPVLDAILPFVMKGPEGGGVAMLGADTGSAAYKISLAKLRLSEALQTQFHELSRRMPEDDEDRVLMVQLAGQLGKLVRRGLRRGEENGHHVATMEL